MENNKEDMMAEFNHSQPFGIDVNLDERSDTLQTSESDKAPDFSNGFSTFMDVDTFGDPCESFGLFVGSSGSTEDSGSGDDNVEEAHTYHDLRPGSRKGGKVISTWLDTDDSGDYEPHTRSSQSSSRRRKPSHKSRKSFVKPSAELDGGKLRPDSVEAPKTPCAGNKIACANSSADNGSCLGDDKVDIIKQSDSKSKLNGSHDISTPAPVENVVWSDYAGAGSACKQLSESPRNILTSCVYRGSQASVDADGGHKPVGTVPKPQPQRCEPQRRRERPKVDPKQFNSGRTIDTKFCHPIVFNHHDETGRQECHFCTNLSYAMFGLGSKQTRVIDTPSGLIELEGGHLGAGQERTRICAICTTHLMMQFLCGPKHEIRPLPDQTSVASDFTSAFMRLVKGQSRPEDRWCSVCPSPALYKCGKRCSLSSHGSCGLLLCEQCAVDLVNGHDGNLQAFLDRVEKKPTEQRPFGLRADAELLGRNGSLASYTQNMAKYGVC